MYNKPILVFALKDRLGICGYCGSATFGKFMRTLLLARLLLALVTGFLTACSSGPQVPQQSYAERLAARCDGYGFQRGTTAFAQCMQQADSQTQAENASSNQQVQQHFKNAQCWLDNNVKDKSKCY